MNLLENLAINFFLNVVCNKSLYYLLYSCTCPIFGIWLDLVLDIWAKMLLANQIARFLDQLYLKNKLMKKPYLIHVDTDSWELKLIQKYWGGFGYKWTLKLALSQEAN